MPVAALQSQKRLFAGVVGASDAVKIDFDFAGWTALGDGLWQTIGPLAHKLPGQDNLHSITQVEDGGSQHTRNQCNRPAAPLGRSTNCFY